LAEKAHGFWIEEIWIILRRSVFDFVDCHECVSLCLCVCGL
jgi:hypothetical protein